VTIFRPEARSLVSSVVGRSAIWVGPAHGSCSPRVFYSGSRRSRLAGNVCCRSEVLEGRTLQHTLAMADEAGDPRRLVQKRASDIVRQIVPPDQESAIGTRQATGPDYNRLPQHRCPRGAGAYARRH